mmetsp:Transcript_25171/g.48232  ORF Transcript_25171/g.48232 Transcript_25171/m.48232 type:complete len:337 (+) Transcript_25171:1118-2128(+)
MLVLPPLFFGVLLVRPTLWASGTSDITDFFFFWYFYMTSLHWAVTQFTPASMEVTPKNSGERLYNLVAICISLVLFPTFLSSITNSVATFRKRNSDYSEAKSDLTQYLQDNQISLELSSLIQSVVVTQYEKKKRAARIHEPEVSLLKFLPRSLKEQMHVQLYQPMIIRHPILKALAACHERTATKICDVAMSQDSLGSMEELFAYGKQAEHVYFVVSGCLHYFEGASYSPKCFQSKLVADDWFCDQVLWVRWMHRGQMNAVQPCEFVKLDGSSFRRIVGQRRMMRAMCRRFAESYLAAINNDVLEGSFNDLGCSTEKLDNIVRIVATASFQASDDE